MLLEELLTLKERKQFEAHKRRLARKYGNKLPKPYFDAYARINFVLRNHSKNNPRLPEFPAWKPKFPATPMTRLEIPGLEQFHVYLKDESYNPVSGTHKDRLAWETIIPQYAKLEDMLIKGSNGDLPYYSIISAGNAATAIGKTNQIFGLPPVHALIDQKTSENKIQRLTQNNIKVFTKNLSKKELTSDEILKATKNPNGIDLTRGMFVKQLSHNYYDWMAYEVLNANPHYVIMPYGTGELYDNILRQYTNNLREKQKDPRLLVNASKMHGVNLIGITSKEELADKLVTTYLSESSLSEIRRTKANIISQNVRMGTLGEHSGIHEITDKDLLKAIRIAHKIKIRAEPSALAGLAWLMKNKHLIKPGSRIVLISTGKGITED